MTTLRILPKTEEGIKSILRTLDIIGNHNVSYYNNTFKFFLGQHKPFPNSFMFFEPSSNSFKFMSGSKLSNLEITSWNDYSPKELSLIQESTFQYYSTYPFLVIVSNANFLLGSMPSNIGEHFYHYMKNTVQKEKNVWSSLLAKKEKIVELF